MGRVSFLRESVIKNVEAITNAGWSNGNLSCGGGGINSAFAKTFGSLAKEISNAAKDPANVRGKITSGNTLEENGVVCVDISAFAKSKGLPQTRYMLYARPPVNKNSTLNKENLTKCYTNLFELAKAKGIRYLAIPAFGIGLNGIANKDLLEILPKLLIKYENDFDQIDFCLIGEKKGKGKDFVDQLQDAYNNEKIKDQSKAKEKTKVENVNTTKEIETFLTEIKQRQQETKRTIFDSKKDVITGSNHFDWYIFPSFSNTHPNFHCDRKKPQGQARFEALANDPQFAANYVSCIKIYLEQCGWNYDKSSSLSGKTLFNGYEIRFDKLVQSLIGITNHNKRLLTGLTQEQQNHLFQSVAAFAIASGQKTPRSYKDYQEDFDKLTTIAEGLKKINISDEKIPDLQDVLIAATDEVIKGQKEDKKGKGKAKDTKGKDKEKTKEPETADDLSSIRISGADYEAENVSAVMRAFFAKEKLLDQSHSSIETETNGYNIFARDDKVFCYLQPRISALHRYGDGIAKNSFDLAFQQINEFLNINDLQGKPIEILFPIHVPGHWILGRMTIDPHGKISSVIYDSMKSYKWSRGSLAKIQNEITNSIDENRGIVDFALGDTTFSSDSENIYTQQGSYCGGIVTRNMRAIIQNNDVNNWHNIELYGVYFDPKKYNHIEARRSDIALVAQHNPEEIGYFENLYQQRIELEKIIHKKTKRENLSDESSIEKELAFAFITNKEARESIINILAVDQDIIETISTMFLDDSEAKQIISSSQFFGKTIKEDFLKQAFFEEYINYLYNFYKPFGLDLKTLSEVLFEYQSLSEIELTIQGSIALSLNNTESYKEIEIKNFLSLLAESPNGKDQRLKSYTEILENKITNLKNFDSSIEPKFPTDEPELTEFDFDFSDDFSPPKTPTEDNYPKLFRIEDGGESYLIDVYNQLTIDSIIAYFDNNNKLGTGGTALKLPHISVNTAGLGGSTDELQERAIKAVKSQKDKIEALLAVRDKVVFPLTINSGSGHTYYIFINQRPDDPKNRTIQILDQTESKDGLNPKESKYEELEAVINAIKKQIVGCEECNEDEEIDIYTGEKIFERLGGKIISGFHPSNQASCAETGFHLIKLMTEGKSLDATLFPPFESYKKPLNLEEKAQIRYDIIKGGSEEKNPLSRYEIISPATIEDAFSNDPVKDSSKSIFIFPDNDPTQTDIQGIKIFTADIVPDINSISSTHDFEGEDLDYFDLGEFFNSAETEARRREEEGKIKAEEKARKHRELIENIKNLLGENEFGELTEEEIEALNEEDLNKVLADFEAEEAEGEKKKTKEKEIKEIGEESEKILAEIDKLKADLKGEFELSQKQLTREIKAKYQPLLERKKEELNIANDDREKASKKADALFNIIDETQQEEAKKELEEFTKERERRKKDFKEKQQKLIEHLDKEIREAFSDRETKLLTKNIDETYGKIGTDIKTGVTDANKDNLRDLIEEAKAEIDKLNKAKTKKIDDFRKLLEQREQAEIHSLEIERIENEEFKDFFDKKVKDFAKIISSKDESDSEDEEEKTKKTKKEAEKEEKLKEVKDDLLKTKVELEEVKRKREEEKKLKDSSDKAKKDEPEKDNSDKELEELKELKDQVKDLKKSVEEEAKEITEDKKNEEIKKAENAEVKKIENEKLKKLKEEIESVTKDFTELRQQKSELKNKKDKTAQNQEIIKAIKNKGTLDRLGNILTTIVGLNDDSALERAGIHLSFFEKVIDFFLSLFGLETIEEKKIKGKMTQIQERNQILEQELQDKENKSTEQERRVQMLQEQIKSLQEKLTTPNQKEERLQELKNIDDKIPSSKTAVSKEKISPSLSVKSPTSKKLAKVSPAVLAGV